MRIILEEDPAWEEVEVTIRCKEVTPQVAGAGGLPAAV